MLQNAIEGQSKDLGSHGVARGLEFLSVLLIEKWLPDFNLMGVVLSHVTLV